MVKKNKKAKYPASKRSKKSTRPRLKAKKRSFLLTFFLVFLSLVFIGAVTSAGVFVGVYSYFSKDLPSIDKLKEYHPKTVTYFYSDDDRVIGAFSHERRLVLPLPKIPSLVINAFIAAEDANFYSHRGIDLLSIARAFIKNFSAGRIVQGGSTITQQVTRTFLLTKEKTYTRKIREAILAYRIDQNLSKEQILYLYLNQIYLGNGAYGVQAAAKSYFDQDVSTLSVAQAALIAGLTQAPSRYSPYSNPDRARERQLYTLGRMRQVGFITPEDEEKAKAQRLVFYDLPNPNITVTPHFTEHVRRVMEKQYGAERLYNDGLKVYTTVNIEMQRKAREAVRRGMSELTKRHEYKGAIRVMTERQANDFLTTQVRKMDKNPLKIGRETLAVVNQVDTKAGSLVINVGSFEGRIEAGELKWALRGRRKISDVFKAGALIEVRAIDRNKDTGLWLFSLEQEPEVQAALLSVDLDTGYVKAMIGGRDFSQSQFNRATQARRQPGSAFKPIIYTAAMDNGFTPASIIIDSPIVYDDFLHMRRWKPRNYGNKFYGPTMLHTALAKSRNVITIKLLQKMGLKPAIEYARKMGITSPLNPDLSLALGSSGVSLLELVTAYTVFPRLGQKVEPLFIRRVEDRDGNLIESFEPKTEQVISPETAYVMLNLLRGVVKYGTATRMKALQRPVAGKTGTTNDLADAWFMGFTPGYLTGAWVGYDEIKRMGDHETGSRAAAPIFLYYMQDILSGKPPRDFEIPPNVTFASINPKTGALAGPDTPNPVLLCFKEGTVGTGISEVDVRVGGADEDESVLSEKDL